MLAVDTGIVAVADNFVEGGEDNVDADEHDILQKNLNCNSSVN